MKQIKHALQIALLLPLSYHPLWAQNQTMVDPVKPGYLPSLRNDEAIDQEDQTFDVKPWQRIAAKDVLFKKRAWREIDVRQKQNIAFQYPGDDETGGGMYIETLLAAVRDGRLQAFADDRFSIPLSAEAIDKKMKGEPQHITLIRPEDGSEIDSVVYPQFDPRSVTRFRIKEDWIFDANEGRMKVRILGLAPYQDRYAEDGTLRASAPMFWLYYPEVRPVHAMFKVYNPKNDVHRITWDDYFEQRQFASVIIQSTLDNPLQEAIRNYHQGIDALNMSQALSETLFQKEHDTWQP